MLTDTPRKGQNPGSDHILLKYSNDNNLLRITFHFSAFAFESQEAVLSAGMHVENSKEGAWPMMVSIQFRKSCTILIHPTCAIQLYVQTY